MPTTPQVNTQQVLQMGSHTEKVQQTIQYLPNVTAQQLNNEREVSDILKRVQVQKLENIYFIDKIDPKTGAKKRVRMMKKKKVEQESKKLKTDKNMLPELNCGRSINIQA